MRATEEDHVPSRILFNDKQWPEGYVFPACAACNRASRHDEQVVAMLARIYPGATSEKERKAIEERIRAVAHNFPDVLLEMKPTANQVRNAAKRYGWDLSNGITTSDLPVLSVRGPLVNAAIAHFGRKLFSALYYKHLGHALPATSGIAVKWYTNVQIDNDEIPRALEPVVRSWPTLVRSNTKLDDQFFYRYGVADTKRVAAFLAFFRRSFAMLGYVHLDAAELGQPESATIVRPFNWSAAASTA